MPKSTIPISSEVSKILFKHYVNDPGGLEFPKLPSTAKVAGIAKGVDATMTGVYGFSERAVAIYGESPVYAGWFEGDVVINGELTVETGHAHFENLTIKENMQVKGDIQMANADIAEDFDIAGAARVQPGTVMVFGTAGALCESYQAYDRRVAGVISGAGEYKPGLVLDKQQASDNRQPVALMGKVFCKVDAEFGAIEVGDLLTTSATPGHAMKAADAAQSFGTVIGKALRSLASGRGEIPILVSLQ